MYNIKMKLICFLKVSRAWGTIPKVILWRPHVCAHTNNMHRYTRMHLYVHKRTHTLNRQESMNS